MKVLYLHRRNVTKQSSWSIELQNPLEGREILSSLLNSAKVSDLVCVLLSSCNNHPFLQSCGDGPVVFMLFSWFDMLYECWGSLLAFSLLVKGLILRSDLDLAQEEGRQRILFCRKLGQQVFIIVLDSPMWFAFRNELGWHRGWSVSPSQDAASDSAPYILAFPNGMRGNTQLKKLRPLWVCQLSF